MGPSASLSSIGNLTTPETGNNRARSGICYDHVVFCVQEQGQPARVMATYERSVAMFPVTHLLWQQYASYLQGNLKVHSIINKVYQRAIRNCPWVGVLWAG